MSLPQSVLITIAATGTAQQGPNVPFLLQATASPVLVSNSGNNAAGVTVGNSAAGAAVGTGGVLEPSAEIGFPGLTNTNQLWFNGTSGDKISVFGS